MILAPQPWLDAAGVQAVLSALGGEARPVGGAVRDALLGLPVSDVDLATPLEPHEVVRRLRAAGLKAVPTGIAHGTVTAVAHGQAIEVTTLRRDVATDGRHATVAFSTDWRDDAARRDFTINALSLDPATMVVSDWFGGLDDIAARRVRFIGDPETRIAEDHLRILRFFRFHARFGAGDPDAAGLAACARRANDLMALSRERIRGELSKLLVAPGAVAVVRTMIAARILTAVLPEIADTAGLERLAAVEPEPHWVRRLAALLPRDAALFDDVAVRLRLSNAERKRLVAMAARPSTEAFAEAWYDGVEAAIDRRLLGGEAVDPALAAWVRPRLPISGRDLIARGLAPGPEVSRRLQDFEAAWVVAGFPADAAVVAALADAAIVEGVPGGAHPPLTRP